MLICAAQPVQMGSPGPVVRQRRVGALTRSGCGRKSVAVELEWAPPGVGHHARAGLGIRFKIRTSPLGGGVRWRGLRCNRSAWAEPTMVLPRVLCAYAPAATLALGVVDRACNAPFLA